MSDTYYKLYRNNRWLGENDNPGSIGGRNTDVGQIGMSLETTIKNLYPINEVPESVANSLRQLKLLLNAAEKSIDDFIEQVSVDVLYRNSSRQ